MSLFTAGVLEHLERFHEVNSSPAKLTFFSCYSVNYPFFCKSGAEYGIVILLDLVHKSGLEAYSLLK